jgi:hypothetical protein
MDQNLPLQDPPKFTQNLDFWFENKPSGNPVEDYVINVHIFFAEN